MMTSKHMPIARERMNFLMEGVLFLVKSQKRYLVLDQPMMGLMHPHLWWAHFAEVCYYKSVHTPSLAGTHRDENWVKGFFLLMPQEEQEAATYSIDELMVQPRGMKISPFPFCVYKKHQRHLFDVFIMHGYAWKFHLSQFG